MNTDYAGAIICLPQTPDIKNISGRQRMELYYLVKNWGFNAYEDEFQKAHEAFTQGLQYLNAYSGNTLEIMQLLQKTDKSLKLFNHTVSEKNNAFMISLTTGQMLEHINKATALYSLL